MLLAKGADDTTQVEGLKNEVQALKGRCDMLEKAVNDLKKTVQVLKSRNGTHQKLLEALRQHTVNFEWQEGTLDQAYEGEEYELME